MQPTANSFTVRLLVEEAERTQALAFIDHIAWKSHRSAPPPPPELLLAAYQGEAIVSTISLDFGRNNSPLPCELIWDFDRSCTPLPFERQYLVQYGRWMASQAGVSAAVVYAAAVVARAVGKKYVVCEMKEPARVRLTHFGIELQLIEGATLAANNVSESGRPYYLTPPPPCLYMTELEHVERACLERLPVLIELECAFQLASKEVS